LARSGSFKTSLAPFGGETDLSKYQIGAIPTVPTTGGSAPSMYGGSAADQLASYAGSDYGQDFGSDYWNSILTSERWSGATALETKAMAEARAAGDWNRVLQIRQGGGFGPSGLGSSIQQELVDQGQQIWVGDAGVTNQAPVKPTVAPAVGVMPNPIIPAVTLPLKVADKAYTDLRAFMGVK